MLILNAAPSVGCGVGDYGSPPAVLFDALPEVQVLWLLRVAAALRMEWAQWLWTQYGSWELQGMEGFGRGGWSAGEGTDREQGAGVNVLERLGWGSSLARPVPSRCGGEDSLRPSGEWVIFLERSAGHVG